MTGDTCGRLFMYHAGHFLVDRYLRRQSVSPALGDTRDTVEAVEKGDRHVRIVTSCFADVGSLHNWGFYGDRGERRGANDEMS